MQRRCCSSSAENQPARVRAVQALMLMRREHIVHAPCDFCCSYCYTTNIPPKSSPVFWQNGDTTRVIPAFLHRYDEQCALDPKAHRIPMHVIRGVYIQQAKAASTAWSWKLKKDGNTISAHQNGCLGHHTPLSPPSCDLSSVPRLFVAALVNLQ